MEMKLPVNDDFFVRMSSSRDGSSRTMSMSGLADVGDPVGDDLRRSPPDPGSGELVVVVL